MKIERVTVVSKTTPAGTTLDKQLVINSEAASMVEPFGFRPDVSNRPQVSFYEYFACNSACFQYFASDSSRKSGANCFGLNTLRKKRAGEVSPLKSRSALRAPALLFAVMGSIFTASGSLHGQGILTVTPSRAVTTTAGTGTPGYTGDSGAALSATLASPSGVAYDANGNLYVADAQNHVVREIFSNGQITTVAGNGVEGYGGDNGPATLAFLDTPTGVAVDSTGNIYIADSHNHRIREVSGGKSQPSRARALRATPAIMARQPRHNYGCRTLWLWTRAETYTSPTPTISASARSQPQPSRRLQVTEKSRTRGTAQPQLRRSSTSRPALRWTQAETSTSLIVITTACA